MANRMIYFTLGLFLLICCYSDRVMAGDPDPLQDFCVADEESNVLVNGFVCKDPMQVSANDFFFRGLGQAGNTDNDVGSNVTMANVKQIPGLNTFGISLVRTDYAQNVGHENAVAIAGLSSQFPGVQTIANSLFAANPPLPDSVLSKAFRITQELGYWRPLVPFIASVLDISMSSSYSKD
ncbi:germin-like protein 8-2 [Cryptomeria japonica]|uniref:germin-like protein 8-2 n=1 Tax=Cryptomeria japonica TaxID=3369 RepID=UPI0027DA6943|nr:germin-like protein 8-2 [Cryptomeria japonica]